MGSHVHVLLLLVVQAAATWTGVAATMYQIRAWYSGITCDGTPYDVFISESSTCSTNVSCSTDDTTGASHVASLSTVCTTDYMAAAKELFGDSPYLLLESYTGLDCKTFGYAEGFFASGNCEGSSGFSAFSIAIIDNNGSASVRSYNASMCPDSSFLYSLEADADALSSHSCVDYFYKWFSTNDVTSVASSGSTIDVNTVTSAPTSSPTPTPTPSPSPTLSTAAIIGIGTGVFVVIVVVGVAIFCCKRRVRGKSTDSHLQPTASLESAPFAGTMPYRETTGLWHDDLIVAKRIPRDKVQIKSLLSQGAYGEVSLGHFNGLPVAVKMLLPVTRTNLQHVNEFLAEAKMTASMDHPHIVSFIGVAWDSLSDLCVVLEFMDGGDLRSILNEYEEKRYPVGFNRQKVVIALQVCHALAYLHSLMPPVIHRDLKSRNVLLSRAMEAKLSDFGVSRERMERTMTAGVGTSLWMAPEVMLGEWYDDKADMFSFGVLLSELDVHTLPYANAKKRTRDSYGRQLPETVLLQQIAAGNLCVEFSVAGPQSITQLGYACVSVEPSLRPSAAEVLYRLQTTLTHEL
ncbi:hypothetical protein PF008_g5159 [Phytophthora fragariae]|uniref:Protein kinase domain-containing protein n=1 Tax=Phytophthora fragariae TaxID=53985 RepID=A0A6G0S953_9STRA|nr:hypothetical protein PF008_g5159 [Phytophthora fragariae]